MRALVILPTYNERDNVDAVLRLVRQAAPDADVLVVDDASPDGTADVAQGLAGRLGRIEVLRRPGKAGLGSAYRTGFRHALSQGYEAVVEMDADLSHDPAAVPSLLGALVEGADLCIGSRYVPGGTIPDWTLLRRAISRFGCWYARTMLRLDVRDATSGFRAFRAEALRTIDLDAVRADGYGFQVEMAYRVARAGGRIVELPIEFRDRTLGRSKMSARIVAEAFVLVSWWAVRDRLARLTGHRDPRGARPTRR